jgi:hypothetical protein
MTTPSSAPECPGCGVLTVRRVVRGRVLWACESSLCPVALVDPGPALPRRTDKPARRRRRPPRGTSRPSGGETLP